MRVAACRSAAALLSPDLYPQCETLVEADFNWRASEVLTGRCEVCEPQPHCEVACVEGNYQSYKEDLRKRKGIDADQPHRVAYRKLVRA
jgi:hypothetical protein